jgi:hypothetical protein
MRLSVPQHRGVSRVWERGAPSSSAGFRLARPPSRLPSREPSATQPTTPGSGGPFSTDFGTESLDPGGARRVRGRPRGARIPGVASAAATFIVPANGNGWNDNVRIDGTAVTRQLANFNRVSPAYFATMGTPLRAGRDFTEADRAGSAPVAIVTETFARKFLGGTSPLGRTFRIVNPGPKADHAYEIVGMVKDAKYTDLRRSSRPSFFSRRPRTRAAARRETL